MLKFIFGLLFLTMGGGFAVEPSANRSPANGPLDYGGLDPKFFPPGGWHPYLWNESGDWIEISAEREGLRPEDSSFDLSEFIKTLVGRYSEKKIKIIFPAGTWRLTSSCALKKPGGGLIIRGAGMAKTHFVLDTDADVSSEFGIDAKSAEPGKVIKLLRDLRRGDETLEMTPDDAAGLKVGRYLSVNADIAVPVDRDHPKGVCVAPRQMVRILSIRESEVRVDMRIGIDMPGAEARVYFLGEECGIEGIHFSRVRKGPDGCHVVHFQNVAKGFVRDCEIEGLVSGGIVLDKCRDLIVTRNWVHDMFGNHFTGGLGDGIIAGFFSTGIHITDNRLWNLRHMIISTSANFCVISYNRLDSNYFHYGDLAEHNGHHGHNNLYEGNTGCEMTTDWARQTHMPTWFITYFRNSAISSIGSVNGHSASYAIIGNEVEGKTAIANTPTLVYETKPARVSKWPLFGP